jgi:hypothetical protein
MWVALANTYGYCNSDSDSDAYCNTWRQNYPHTAAASHAAAPALRPAFNGHFFGDSRSLASPRNAYFS